MIPERRYRAVIVVEWGTQASLAIAAQAAEQAANSAEQGVTLGGRWDMVSSVPAKAYVHSVTDITPPQPAEAAPVVVVPSNFSVDR